MSFVQAKAQLSKLVDQAEHKHQPVLILRHGKPAAAIVPVDLLSNAKAPPPMTDPGIDALWAGFGSGDTYVQERRRRSSRKPRPPRTALTMRLVLDASVVVAAARERRLGIGAWS